MEASAHLLQRHAHGQQLAAPVQGEVRQTAHLSQYAPGKIAQAQHLCIPAGGVAQSPAQRHLRLVGHMLRNNKHLSPGAAVTLYRLQNPLGFSRACPADPKLQHTVVPPCCFLILDYTIAQGQLQTSVRIFFLPYPA